MLFVYLFQSQVATGLLYHWPILWTIVLIDTDFSTTSYSNALILALVISISTTLLTPIFDVT